MKTIRRLAPLILAPLVANLPWVAGCDDDDDIGHTPPPGKGSLAIDNNTSNNIGVFIDGREQPDAREDQTAIYDLDPGSYRVVLEEQGGDQSFRGDIDILEQRLTVLDVTYGSRFIFDVVLTFE